ncbi:MAG: 2-C-methyl-D-erythritol 2,4-cyclodiphosphate synthase [Proteobacteria bacterium]|nr:2-C-methyl-D-erythritol 2,4-cyclodiphosphate synthase [Pseudomonadota bacterium]
MMRIGQGFDAHRFSESGRLVLGGVVIPFEKGLEAHSDGDVVIHALCDAILGGLALGDIGQHFPDSSATYAGIDSRILLRQVAGLMQQARYQINNLDITIIAQVPKLAPHLPAMQDILASDLQTSRENVSLKATTTEQMGFTGRGEGIAAMAIVLLSDAQD